MDFDLVIRQNQGGDKLPGDELAVTCGLRFELQLTSEALQRTNEKKSEKKFF